MGNKTGWIVGGVIVLIVLAVITKLVFFPSPTAPTSVTRAKEFMKALPVDTPIDTIAGSVPSAAGNGGDDYKAAFETFKGAREAIDAFHKTIAESENRKQFVRGELAPPEPVLSALKTMASRLASGARKGAFEYSFTHTPDEFEVGYFYQGALDLIKISRCMSTLMLYHFGRKEYPQAVALQRNLIVMGWHMANEDVRLHMTEVGLDIQNVAANGLVDIYRNWGEKDHAEEIQKVGSYQRAVNSAKRPLTAKMRLFRKLKIDSGDILNIAENHKSRAFRVQAILFLGRLRFEVSGRRDDMRYTDKLLDKYIDSSDPFEEAAARAARDFTEDDWKKLTLRPKRLDM